MAGGGYGGQKGGNGGGMGGGYTPGYNTGRNPVWGAPIDGRPGYDPTRDYGNPGYTPGYNSGRGGLSTNPYPSGGLSGYPAPWNAGGGGDSAQPYVSGPESGMDIQRQFGTGTGNSPYMAALNARTPELNPAMQTPAHQAWVQAHLQRQQQVPTGAVSLGGLQPGQTMSFAPGSLGQILGGQPAIGAGGNPQQPSFPYNYLRR